MIEGLLLLRLFGRVLGWFRRFLVECWPVWVEIVFAVNASLAIAEPVFLFHGTHVHADVVVDFRLQLPRVFSEGVHLVRVEEQRFPKFIEIAGDFRESPVDVVQTAVNRKFSSKMWPSQVSSQRVKFGQESVSVQSIGGFRTVDETVDEDKAKFSRFLFLFSFA